MADWQDGALGGAGMREKKQAKRFTLGKKKMGMNNRRSKIGNGFVILLLILLGAFMAFPL